MRSLASLLVLLSVAALGLAGCGSSRPYTTEPIKTFDPDNRDIDRPETIRENQYWDPIDRTFFYQIGKVLDLGWTGRKIGRGLRLVGPEEADNVNTLDEVPNSSWFTQRHFYFPMTTEELQRGPNVTDGPAPGPWTVVSAKTEGKTKGFTIEDTQGDRYIIKFDGASYPEATSAAEVISTKIFYAFGFSVPQNTIEYFDPADLRIAEDAEVDTEEGERSMTTSDLAEILDPLARRDDGRIRAMASKYVDGRPIGPWSFIGTHDDNPNDRVRHEERRELRGLSVLGSWLNDTDRRDANTLRVFTTEVRPSPDGGAPDTVQYVRHFILDMGSTLGANAAGTHRVKHGQEYYVDPRSIARQTLTLGLREKPWEFQPLVSFYPATAYFTAKYFEPEEWVPTYPNPAYEKRTDRDGFWGAKRIMAFSEADIRAIVATGEYSNPDAEEYIVQTLLARRDEIGRYWFKEVNPLDRFVLARLDDGASPYTLEFDDLAVDGGLALADASRYRYTVHHDDTELAQGTTDVPTISVPALPDAARDAASEDARVLRVEIVTLRDGEDPSNPMHVYLHFGPDGIDRVVGIERD